MTETENTSLWQSYGNLIKKHFIGENVCSPFDFRLSLFAEWSKGKFCLLFLPSPHFYLDLGFVAFYKKMMMVIEMGKWRNLVFKCFSLRSFREGFRVVREGAKVLNSFFMAYGFKNRLPHNFLVKGYFSNFKSLSLCPPSREWWCW